MPFAILIFIKLFPSWEWKQIHQLEGKCQQLYFLTPYLTYYILQDHKRDTNVFLLFLTVILCLQMSPLLSTPFILRVNLRVNLHL